MKLKKWLTAIMMLAGLSFMVGCGEKELTPMNYFDLSYEGMNGEGKTTVRVDAAAFTKDLINAVPEDKRDELMFVEVSDLLTYSVDKEENLSNGDTVTLKLDWDNSFLKKYKLKFIGESKKTITVEGLEEYIEVDAFDPEIFDVDEDTKGVHIAVSGASPLLTVKLINDIDKKDIRSKLTYEIESDGMNTTFIEENDPVTIRVRGYLENPYRLKEETKEMTFTNTARYVQSLEDIDEDGWNTIYEYLNEFYKDHCSVNGRNELIWREDKYSVWMCNFNDPVTVNAYSDFAYEGIYLVTLKKGKKYSDYYDYYENTEASSEFYDPINRIVIPFSFKFSCDIIGMGGEFEDEIANGCIIFNDPIIDKEGKLILKNDETSGIYVRKYLDRTAEEIMIDEIQVIDRDDVRVDIDMSRING